MVALVGRANAILSRYDGHLESLVNPGVMLSPLLMKEAELSSRIEGTIATANEVYQQQAGQTFEPEKEADIQEIVNYRQTLRLGGDAILEGEIGLHLIRQMHGELLKGVRGQSKNPGRFRQTQNWIGPRNRPIEEATFIPPSPLKLQDHLEAFSDFLSLRNRKSEPRPATLAPRREAAGTLDRLLQSRSPHGGWVQILRADRTSALQGQGC